MGRIELDTLAGWLTEPYSRINIPIYQRAYDWEDTHINQFIDDIEFHMKADHDDTYQFLGMIVYVSKEDDSGEIEIIDGQQRITTYYLLASILYDWICYEPIRKPYEEKFDNTTIENLDSYKHALKRILFTEKSLTDHFVQDYSAYIVENKSLFYKTKLYTDNTYMEDKKMTELLLMDIKELQYKMKKLNDDTSTDEEDNPTNPQTTRRKLFIKPQKRKIIPGLHAGTAKSRSIAKNHDQLQEWFRTKTSKAKIDKRIDFLMSLSKVLLKKLKIIPFKTTSHTEAFTLFEVLNDRGLQVSQSDLLKNLCIKKGGSDFDKQKLMYDKWQEVINEKLEEKNKVHFLRTSYNSKEIFRRKSELYAGYKDLLKKKDFEETKSYIEVELNQDVESYNNCLLEGDGLPISIQKWITLLYHTGVVQWRTLALSLLRIDGDLNQQKKITNILREVFEIIFHMVVNGTRTNEIESLFPKIAIEVDKDKLELTLNKLKTFKKAKNFTYEKSDIKPDAFSDNKFCGLILLMYTDGLGNPLTQQKYTVEHILSQKPKENDWKEDFPNLFSIEDDERRVAFNESVFCIGNMMLLEDRANKSLGNLGFEKKKNKMKDLSLLDILPADNGYNIFKVSHFTQDTINSRFEEIKKVITKKYSGFKFNITNG
jgi:uncharacterized protein with ParB-like and HNH nuclease domain